MELNHYDENGYFTGSSTAKLDPVGNQPMVPARATSVPLPVGTVESYQANHFDGTAWTTISVPSKVDALLAEKNAKGTSLYEDIAGVPTARSAQDIANDDAVYDKDVLKSTEFSSLQADLYEQLNVAFGTSDPNTATADYNTYKVMSASPALFSSEGLLAEIATTTYAIGDALDSDPKIKGYADEMLTKIDTYAVYRMNRKKQYKDAIIAIG